MHVVLVLCAAVAVAAAVRDSTPSPLITLTNEKAVCMDGTPSGYYISSTSFNSAATSAATAAVQPNQAQPSAVSSDTFVIFLQGGGECTTEVACKSHLASSLGSSKYFAKQLNDFEAIASGDCDSNPYFCNATRVYVPYCSQDLHSGQAYQPSQGTWGLRFAGAHTFRAIVDDLVSNHGLNSAHRLILSGGSAGGIGVWHHLDYLQQRFPHIFIYGAPIAGFYFPAYPYTGINHTESSLADFRPPAWKQHYELWNSYVDESCKAANPNEPWFCLLANVSYPYIDVPVFVSEAQTDKVVLLYHDWVPEKYVQEPPEQAYLQEWSRNMTHALHTAYKLGRYGVFNPACFIHTDFYHNKPLINGTSYDALLSAWLEDEGKTPMMLMDDCGVMCNPSC